MKKRFVILLIGAVLLFMCGYIWYGNFAVEVNEYEILADIPEGFDNFTIVQLSDMHNAQLGENNKNVLDALKSIDADVIVMTGDMIDSRDTKIDVTLSFVKEAVKLAPCYYVTGNHEARINIFGDEYSLFKAGLVDLGVRVLENESVDITLDGEAISLTGIHDTGFDFSTAAGSLVKASLPEGEGYKILLAHRPEYFDQYDGADLILSGHAHGGQIRLPFIGGLFAPGQGVLPKYDGGVYEEDGRTMVVSRGLGNSLFPIRVNNKPEIVVVKLKAK